MLKRFCEAGGILATAAIYASASFAQGYPVFKVADTSTQIPGAPPGQTFASFDAPVASRTPNDIPGPETANVAFRAQGASGLIGIFNATPSPSLTNPPFTVLRVADTTTAIPSAVPPTTFSDFTRPTFGSGFPRSAVIFTGTAPSGNQGVYREDPFAGGLSSFGVSAKSRATAPSAMTEVSAFGQGDADGLMTLIVRDQTQIMSADDAYLGPPSVFHFAFNGPGSRTTVAYAVKSDPMGPVNQIRAYRLEVTGYQIETAVDFSTLIPGGIGTFNGFGDPAAASNSVFFRGAGPGGQEGIYEHRFGPGPTGVVTRVDRTTPVPGRPGVTFTAFSDPAGYGNYAFKATLSDGSEALYSQVFIPGGPNGLGELISTGDVIDGKTIDALEISREAIGGTFTSNYAFKATFTDGSEGIYVLKLPEPGAMALGIAAIALLANRRRISRKSISN